MAVTFKMTGDKELNRAMRKLATDRGADGAALSSLARALTPVVATAKSLAPAETGLLRETIGVRYRQYRRSRTTFGSVGPRTRMGRNVTRTSGLGLKYEVYSNPTKYAHLVEFGTVRTAAKPFLRPSYATHEKQIIATVGAGLGKYLEKAAARNRARKRNR